MTQEEVDLIYNYLHEHYEYADGELIRIKSIHGMQDGHKLGSFRVMPTGHGYLLGTIRINSKKYNKQLAQFIYLFVNKKFPEKIKYLDGNITNTKIENIIGINLINAKDIKEKKIKKLPTGVRKQQNHFRVDIRLNGIRKYLGYFNTPELAHQAYLKAKQELKG